MPSIHRTLSVVAIAAAGVGLGACGGGGSSGSEADYVKDYQSGCQTLRSAATDFLTLEQTALKTKKAPSIDAEKQAVGTFFTTFANGLDKLGDAKAPDKFSDFQDKFSDQESKTASKLRDAADQAKKSTSSQQLGTITRGLGNIGGNISLPKELLGKAPACGALGGSGASGGAQSTG